MRDPKDESQRFFFRKKERLSSKRIFTHLFEHGSSLRVGVLKFFYLLDLPENLSDTPVSVAVVAPKRAFKKAPDRNLLKRRMREAYRLNSHLLYDEVQRSPQNLVLLIKYNIRSIKEFPVIENDMVQGIRKIGRQIHTTSGFEKDSFSHEDS